MSTTKSTHSDPTFRSYSAEQAKVYASQRLSYEPAIYDVVLDYHNTTGGQFGLVMDCGCGPGNATRDIALSFDQASGVDAGSAMIDTAKEIGGLTKSGSAIRFEVSPAEEFSHIKGLEPGSVDMITSAMAAHWFEMDKFWVEAAKVLKPGGTVALWTRASSFPHPSTPNYKKIREIMLRLEREDLAPYETPANRISRDMYDNLLLPWNVTPPIAAFPESKFVKHEYDREGVLSNGESFFGGGSLANLDQVEKGLATASMVTRWRAAHPDLVGTDEDVVTKVVRDLRDALGGDVEVLQGSGTAILLFKRAQ